MTTGTIDERTTLGTAPAGIPDEVLAEFAQESGTVYLDTCSRGLLPRSAREAVVAHLDRRVAGNAEKAALFDALEGARADFAGLIGATADEIAITKNVSDGLSMIAGALPWKAGDNLVVCLDLEHPNNVYPWLNLAKRVGIEVRAVAQRDGHIDAEALADGIDDRTRLATVSTVTFSPGFRTDLAPLGEVCRARGVPILADGVQSVGILDTDVDSLGIDAMAVSTQKGLLGLYGFGFLYCRREWAESLRPQSLARFGVDLGAAHEATTEAEAWRLMPGARRFDVGNYNYAGAIVAGVSLKLLLGVGTERIEAHVGRLAHRLASGLLQLGLPVVGGPPGPHLASIVSLGTPGGGHDSSDDPLVTRLYERLSAAGVKLTIRRGTLRMALHLYNTDDDIDRVLELVADG